MVGNRSWRAWTAAVVIVISHFISNAAHAEKNPGAKKPVVHESIQGQYVVRLTDPMTAFTNNGLEQRLESKIIDIIRDDMVLVERKAKETTSVAIQRLLSKKEVLSAVPNYVFRANKIPNDSDYGKLWGLKNSGALDSGGMRGLGGVDISAERAWDKTTGSKDIVLAVIDTGIDFKIADLAPNAWVNEKELKGTAGIDDDGNGYVDDVHGYDFVNNDGDPTDDNGHGSHCAGTIGARGDDGAGVAGVAWNVSLMGVKFLDKNGSGSLANAIKAIDYARINGARIMSNSWGGGPFIQALYDAIDATRASGALFLAAAGNDGSDNDATISYPSGYDVDNVIAVAAVDNRGELADFSNWGKTRVDIAAPGVQIYSTVPGGFDSYSGTSMATPHVAGVAALVLADNPQLTYQEVKQKILTSARPLSSLTGKIATGAMLDAHLALTGNPPPQDPNDVSTWKNVVQQSYATAHPYPDDLEQTFTIHVPGAKRISAHFLKFETEVDYDTVQFLNAAGETLGTWSGDKTGRYAPIADGDTLILKVTSDSSVDAHGFDIDTVHYE